MTSTKPMLLANIQSQIKQGNMTQAKIWLLRLINLIIWTKIGVLGGGVLAFFVFFFTPAGPQRVYPAIVAFTAILIACVGFGVYISFFLMSKKNQRR